MLTMLAVLALLVAQASAVSPFEGEWRTDVQANLKASSIPAVESGISFTVTAKHVKISSRNITPDGRSFSIDEVLDTDGKTRPSKQSPNWTVVAKWENPLFLDVRFEGRGVNVTLVHVTYSLTADRKILTRRSVYTSNGRVYHTEERVFYR